METKNLLGTVLNLKAVGVFLVLWGLTFLLRGLTDLTYYVYNYGAADFSEVFAETALYIVGDVVYIAAAIALWVIAAKLLSAKTAIV
jgi:flagellar biosynthesis protein FliR